MACTVCHESQRYPTCGDYTDAHGTELYTISRMDNTDYEKLVFLHEFLEKWLVDKAGVALADIDAFDIAFEAARAPGNTDEPGDDPAAPYRAAHQFATCIERLVCDRLGVSWIEYEQAVVAL